MEDFNFVEDEFTEFKRSYSEKVIESLVAFSNFKGGRVIVGVDEVNKKIIGVNISNETLQQWQNEIKNKTEPFITPDIYVEEINSKQVVIFEVIEFPIKPVSFKNRYYLRRNNSNHQMSLGEVSDMFLKTKRSSWDFYMYEGATLNDLDENKILKTMKMIEDNMNIKLGTIDEFLQKYELVTSQGVSNAAMLLFSKKPLRETDIQIGLFQDEITIKKNKIIRADLLLQVEEIMDFIKAYILKEFIITGKPQREERWQYPLDAIRELVINAIIHRDYRGVHSQFKVFPDRLDFFNSGRLPYNLSVVDIIEGKKRSEPRNILLAEIFRDCGLIERYGSGVKRVNEELKNYGLPLILLEEVGGGVAVIVYSKEYKSKEKGSKREETREKTREETREKTREKILILMNQNPNINQNELSMKLGISIKGVEWQIKRLKDEGVLQRVGPDKGGYWEVIK